MASDVAAMTPFLRVSMSYSKLRWGVIIAAFFFSIVAAVQYSKSQQAHKDANMCVCTSVQ